MHFTMQAVVGFSIDSAISLYVTPFAQDDINSAEDSRTQLNTLRECGSAVFTLGMDVRFDRAAADVLLRQATYAAWAVLRGDLTQLDTCTFLKTTLFQRPLVPVRELNRLVVPRPKGLACIIQSLFRAPHQDARFAAQARRRHVVAPVSIDVTFEAQRVRREPLAKIGLACLDATKSVMPTARLLETLHSSFESMDAWLALLHRVWHSTEKTDALAPAAFEHELLQKEYDASSHGGVIVWNELLKHAAPMVEADAVLALFKLFQPCFRRAVSRVLLHAQVLVVCGLFAVIAMPETESFSVNVSELSEMPPVPAWFEGLDVLTPSCARFWKAHDMLWQRVEDALSEDRLVAEVQAQLPSMLLARGACAFADRLVQLKTYSDL